MNRRLQLKIASRLHELLLRELGEGIDAARMVAEPLYARDVLLVCDAMPASEMADLADAFRKVAHDADDSGDAEPSGFSPSRFLGSIFGALGDSPPAAQGARSKRWFGRSRSPDKH